MAVHLFLSTACLLLLSSSADLMMGPMHPLMNPPLPMTPMAMPMVEFRSYVQRPPVDVPMVLDAGDPFDPATEMCCLGKAYPQPKRRSYSGCCGENVWDRTTEVCCSGSVFPWQSGFACCGSLYFNVTESVCCEPGQVVKYPELDEISREFAECCGQEMYDSRSHMCCPGSYAIIEKRYRNTQCCNSQTIDGDADLCCNGEIITKTENATHCCGDRGYDPSTQVCCGDTGTVVTVPLAPFLYTGCCNDEPFLRRAQGCNHNIVYNLTTEAPCGDKIFDLATELCCEGKNTSVIHTKTKQDDTCCGELLYNHKDQFCCRGITYNRTDANEACCGNYSFNKITQICVSEDLVTFRVVNRSAPSHSGVCGDQSFDPSTQLCCNQEKSLCLDKKNPYDFACCGNVTFDETKELCCLSVENDVDKATLYDRSATNYDFCCNGVPYNSREQVCCGTEIITPTANQSCCGFSLMDQTSQICCFNDKDQVFVPVNTSFIGSSCCGLTAYNYPNERCCGGSVVYNPFEMMCCGETAVPIAGNSTLSCCYNRPYDRSKEVCCNGNIKEKTKEDQTSCCYSRKFLPPLHDELNNL